MLASLKMQLFHQRRVLLYMSNTFGLKDGVLGRLRNWLAVAFVVLPFLLLATPAQAEGPWHHHHHHHHCH